MRLPDDSVRPLQGGRIPHGLALAISSGFFACSLAAAVTPAWSHHAGDSEGLVIFEGTQQGFHVILEVTPREPMAGSVAEFSLWAWRIVPGAPYTGRARLSMQAEGGSTASEGDIQIPERGRAGVSVLYRGSHRFDREGAYHLDLELADLPARWAATLRVYPAPAWHSGILQSVRTGILVVGSLIFLLVLLFGGPRGMRRRLPWPGPPRS